ncbi:MAG: TonB-dependent receptor [Dysgonamonadaceae bacterium]|nr:TonB-dependent receptor [Dysgonamonadaceae bacterium]
MRIITIFLLLFCFQTNINAEFQVKQQEGITVVGTVSDIDGPIIGVNISLKGTPIGTVTDLDGKYTIIVPDKESRLIFTYVGYNSQELIIGNRTTLDVVMKGFLSLDEVVVVGYGVQKKENLTGAVSMVNMEKVLGDRPITSVGAALQGTTPGLVVTGNAIPGTSKSINIRGTTSINGGDPLVLIDNVPGSIDMLNPEDIESVSVLKDAASSAIYGARGAFGVILITTKKARKNTKFQLNYNNNFGFQKTINQVEQASIIETLETLDHFSLDGKYFAQGQIFKDWIGYVKDYNADPSKYPANGIYVPEGQSIYYYLKDNDIQNAVLDKYGFQQTHNVSASGGTDKLTYRISLGYTDQDGILVTNKDHYQRITMGTYLSADITSWLNQSVDVRYAESNRSYIENADGGIYYARFPRWHPDGDIVRNNAPNEPALPVNSPQNYVRLTDPTRYNTANPRIFSHTSIRPVKGLEVVFDYTYDRSDWDKKWFNSPVTMTTIQMGLISSSTPESGRYRNDKQKTTYSAINTYATYQLSLHELHNFKLMSGFAQEHYYRETLWAQRDGMMNLGMPSISGAIGTMNMGDQYRENAIRSGFFRFNYDYLGRYLLEANGRYDGSSKFPAKSRFAFFPSFSAGWQVAQESWMGWSKEWVDEFKLRASWGQIGNQNISEYAFIPDMTSIKSTWIQDGQLPMTLGMPNMVSDSFTWETAETLDFGIDFRLLKGKLSGTYDWYRRDTRGMLMAGKEFPEVVGAVAPLQNAADLRTTGWEFAVTWRDQINNVGYSIGFNIFDARTQITKYANEAGLFGSGIYREGMWLGEIWGYTTDGFYTIDDFEDGWQNGTWRLKEGVTTINGYNNLRPGDIKFKNLRDDPDNNSVNRIDEGHNTIDDPGDRSIIGNNTMRYQYGANFGINWKGFDLSAFFQGVGKRQNWLSGDLMFPLMNGRNGTMYSHQLDFWKPIDSENGNWNPVSPNPMYARLYGEAPNANSNNRQQTKFLSNTAYLRLKNVTLGYRIPSVIVRKISLTNVKLFFSAEDLYTWDHLPKGYDPERLNWGYPFHTTYSFGINITL